MRLRRGFFQMPPISGECLIPGNEFFVEAGNCVVERRLDQLGIGFTTAAVLGRRELHCSIVFIAPADNFEFRSWL